VPKGGTKKGRLLYFLFRFGFAKKGKNHEGTEKEDEKKNGKKKKKKRFKTHML